MRPEPDHRGARQLCVLAVLLTLSCEPVELLTSPAGAPSCLEDRECGVSNLCIGEACTPCPPFNGCQEPEPLGKWTPLVRNGCKVCEFAPASECAGPGECDLTCYQGARCATGCTRFECCANVCQPAGCTGPAPLGCKASCEPGSGCNTCVAADCRCEFGEWRCDVGCADLSGNCTYEP